MAKQLPLVEYHAAMRGGSTTLGWDVVVAYAAKELNALLQTQWAAAGTSKVPVDRPYPRLKTKIYYELNLGAPTLQFDTSDSGSANLTCTVDGTYRIDTINKEGNVVQEGEETTTLPTGVYLLNVNVPIGAVHADGSTSTDKGIVNFPSNQETSTYLVFHFENVQKTVCKIQIVDEKQRDKNEEYEQMVDIADELAAWFQNQSNLHWINVALAQVTNVKPPAEQANVISDLLRPKSFRFSTQSNSSGGLLLIYMQTEGSGSSTGNPDPHFTTPTRSNESIAAIPAGSHSAIIISHDLFLTKFLRKQLASMLGTNVEALDTTEGFKLYCPLSQAKTQFQSSSGGWLSSFNVHGTKIDLAQPPLMALTIKDDASLTTSATWEWLRSGNFSWSVNWIGGGEAGQVDFTIKVNKTISPAVHIANSIQVGISLAASDFVCNIEPHKFSLWDRQGGRLSNDLPNEIQKMRFEFNDVSLHLPELDFFATQNVFAPGKQAILAKSTLSPYDFVVLGDIATAETMSPPTGLPSLTALPPYSRHQPNNWSRLQSSLISSQLKLAESMASSPPQVRMKALFELLYNDDFGFAHDFFVAMTGESLSAVDEVFTKRGYNLSTIDATCMDTLSIPGPDFDLRFCGGAYRLAGTPVDDNVSPVFFVDPKTRNIIANGVPVQNQKTDKAGVVSFTIPQQKRTYSLTFTRRHGDQGETLEDTASGASWPTADPNNRSDVHFERLVVPEPSSSDEGPLFFLTASGIPLLGDDPSMTPWYNSPLILTFGAIMTVYGVVDISLKAIKFGKENIPKLSKLGRKLGFCKQETVPLLIKKMEKEVAEAKVNVTDLPSVEVEFNRIANKEIVSKDMNDAQTRSEVIDAVTAQAREKVIEKLVTRFQGGELASNSVVVAINGQNAFQDAIKASCTKKFETLVSPTNWQPYLKTVVESCVAQKMVTEADIKFKEVSDRADSAENAEQNLAQERLDFDNKIAKEKQEREDAIVQNEKFSDKDKEAEREKLEKEIEDKEAEMKEHEDAIKEEAERARKERKEHEEALEKRKQELERETKKSEEKRKEAFK